MEKPFCNICGHRHTLSEPHRFMAVQPVKPAPPLPVDKLLVPVPSPEEGMTLSQVRDALMEWAAKLDAELERRGWKPPEQKRFDRREYQREYMRKRRAALRGEKNSEGKGDG